jgi:hypothetical protein
MGDLAEVWQDIPDGTNVGHWFIWVRCSGLKK